MEKTQENTKWKHYIQHDVWIIYIVSESLALGASRAIHRSLHVVVSGNYYSSATCSFLLQSQITSGDLREIGSPSGWRCPQHLNHLQYVIWWQFACCMYDGDRINHFTLNKTICDSVPSQLNTRGAPCWLLGVHAEWVFTLYTQPTSHSHLASLLASGAEISSCVFFVHILIYIYISI